MMNVESLLVRYTEDESVQRILDLIEKKENAHIRLSGLVGSGEAVVAAAVIRKTRCVHVFILNDKEDAAYFENDLKNLLEKQEIHFFPDSFKKPGSFEELNSNQVQLRTAALDKLINGPGKQNILVTYPEALFEKVVRQKALKKNILKVSLGEQLDVEFVMEFLNEFGFQRVDFVYEPGEFSVRGGIIDIFSFGNDKPYRIELFGEEVESIRFFDPVSQLSEKKVTRFSIIPNIQTHFESEEKASFLEFLPPTSVFWIKDFRFTMDRMQQLFDKALRIVEAESPSDEPHPLVKGPPAELFETGAGFTAHLESHCRITLGTQGSRSDEPAIGFGMLPQPSFNRNFKRLLAHLKENQQEQLDSIIFSGNPKQIERFYHIFEDLDQDVKFYPVPKSLSKGFFDKDRKLACYTDHQIFERYYKYQIRQGYTRSKALLMKTLKELKSGDYITHIDHGVGVYSGLEKIEVNGQLQEAIRVIYRDNDLLYVNINSLHKISKYVGQEGVAPRVNKLGSDAWDQLKRKTKKKVKDIAKDLIKLYAARKAKEGFAFSPDTYLQSELESSFIYEDTPDQQKATEMIKKDMERSYPMDRLVCGDVGFGKTELAIRAAFKAVADSKQVGVLVPTTILALQHFKTFSDRLEEMPCTVDYINRFKTQRQITQTVKALKEGKIDILIGTHAILGKKVEFKDLGLLVIDEEQKFGVSAKEKLRQLKTNVDTLTLTATPIPRTLHFSMMGARDLSILNTPPLNRQPIHTELHVFDDELIKEALYYEINRGGQVFLVNNRVKNIEEVAAMVKNVCPGLEVDIAHGQMEGKQLEGVMRAFINHQFDVLVCTNIIESGLDIPNANTIIIPNAHQFGLSDLHQLRGRVGRSNKKAFCYLISPPLSTLNRDARKRLQTIEEFSDLGSGFNIAMRDLDIRGAGNLLGAEQSGFIAEIGFDMYHKILDEAMEELKETDFKNLFADDRKAEKVFVKDCQIDTDMQILIPDDYVTNINERLSLYTHLDNIESEKKLNEFAWEMADRFGPVPKPVLELFEAIRLRWQAKTLGFERIILKDRSMKCYFISNQESAFFQSDIFTAIIKFVQNNPSLCRIKETSKYLLMSFQNIENLQKAREVLQRILDTLVPEEAVSPD